MSKPAPQTAQPAAVHATILDADGWVGRYVQGAEQRHVLDPHRVVVTGPAPLYGERLESPDIRAGMAMVIAALCAQGTSTIGNIRQIDRGYERIDERLQGLGAAIERAEL